MHSTHSFISLIHGILETNYWDHFKTSERLVFFSSMLALGDISILTCKGYHFHFWQLGCQTPSPVQLLVSSCRVVKSTITFILYVSSILYMYFNQLRFWFQTKCDIMILDIAFTSAEGSEFPSNWKHYAMWCDCAIVSSRVKDIQLLLYLCWQCSTNTLIQEDGLKALILTQLQRSK